MVTAKMILISHALTDLRSARDTFASVNCPKALDKVRSAIKSAEGAMLRHKPTAHKGRSHDRLHIRQ